MLQYINSVQCHIEVKYCTCFVWMVLSTLNDFSIWTIQQNTEKYDTAKRE